MKKNNLNYDFIPKLCALISLFTSVKLFSEYLASKDFEYELIRNKQLADTDDATKKKMHNDFVASTIERGILLRRRTFSSILLLAIATIMAFIISCFFGKTTIGSFSILAEKIMFPILSIFFFALGTLGRIGWNGQSFCGDTIYERIDSHILWATYFLGMLFGVLALI